MGNVETKVYERLYYTENECLLSLDDEQYKTLIIKELEKGTSWTRWIGAN